jgi:hypothetical protein
VMFDQELEKLKNPKTRVSDAEITATVETIERALSTEPDQGERAEAGSYVRRIQSRLKNSEEVQRARQNLLGMGLLANEIEDWHPLRFIVVDEFMQYEKIRDEQRKWMGLPYYQAKAGLEAMAKEIKTGSKQAPMLKMLPAIEKVKRAQARLDQRLAYLQILEAIRLHAFANGGQLPKSLSDINLPLPIDPVSGKPFEYSVEKGVATLHGMNPNETPETNRYYVIMMAK